MRESMRLIAVVLLVAAVAGAQTEISLGAKASVREARAARVAPPEGLRERVRDGKLVLTLRDLVELTLENNTEVRISGLQRADARFSLLGAHRIFDPLLTSSYSPERSTSPTISQLEGATTLTNLTHPWRTSFSQLLWPGTSYNVSFNTTRSASNSAFALFNPSFFSTLNFQVTQPLLRGRGWQVTRAPVIIARRNLQQSLFRFEAEVSDEVLRAIEDYWNVVQARKDLDVRRKSLELAEETYKRDKRALELGALPPLDIYRSESEVAQRRLAVIQSEYRLKQLEDRLRRTIGADLDLQIAALDLELIEPLEPPMDSEAVDLLKTLEDALRARPELQAIRQQLANEETNIDVAENGRLPEVNLTGFYTSSGRGGTLIDDSSGTPIVVSRGGWPDALGQVGSFDFPTYGASLQFSLPIRNRGAEADLGRALISRHRAQYQLRQAEQNVMLEVRDAVNRLEQSRLTVKAAEIALDLARKNLAAEERKYQLGAQTIFFVLEAQTALAQAELELTQAQIGVQRAQAAVDRARASLLGRFGINVEDVPN